MAADPLQNVSKNQPLQLDHRSVNAWNDAARAHRATKNNGGAGEQPKRFLPPSLHVLIRNDTGEDLEAGSVLRVAGWVVSPVDYEYEVRARPVLSGGTPSGTSNLIAVLSEPIPDGQFGDAIIPGPVAVCDILVNSASHDHARAISGDHTRLESAVAGFARIVAWESSGSVRRAIVILGESRFFAGTGDEGVSVSTPGSFYGFKVPPYTFYVDSLDGMAVLRGATPDWNGLVLAEPQDWAGGKTVSPFSGSIGGTTCFLESSGVDTGDANYAATEALLRINALDAGNLLSGGGAGALCPTITSLQANTGYPLFLWFQGEFGSAGRLVLTVDRNTGGTGDARYAVERGGAIYDGATGTLGPGAAAKGGIVTSVGSGSFPTLPITLTTDVTGILPEANGGTGYSTLAAALDALGGINL